MLQELCLENTDNSPCSWLWPPDPSHASWRVQTLLPAARWEALAAGQPAAHAVPVALPFWDVLSRRQGRQGDTCPLLRAQPLTSPHCSAPQSIPWKWLFGATAIALGGVALSVVIAARN